MTVYSAGYKNCDENSTVGAVFEEDILKDIFFYSQFWIKKI